MSKSNRGKGLMEVPGRGRGTCPVCGRTAIKVLYDAKKGERSLKVCKRCRARDLENLELKA